MTVQHLPTPAYLEGAAAFRRGVSRGACPYGVTSRDGMKWLDGYDDAQEADHDTAPD